MRIIGFGIRSWLARFLNKVDENDTERLQDNEYE